jgi:hypothetical protein
MSSHSPIDVYVSPAAEYQRRTRLFEALGSVYPVRFRTSGDVEPDGTVVFLTSDAEPPTTTGPTLALVAPPKPAVDGRPGAINILDSELVPRAVRARTLADSSTSGGALPAAFDGWGELLASSPDGPVWVGRPGLLYAAASWPAEPEPGQPLREQLKQGRFMGLLPLAHFLRQLSERFGWEQPQSKACFVFDDPNLHWWSYGFLDYRRLSAHADAHDYHVTAATVPLDQWYIHRATADFLRREGSRISFAIHGNNHTRHELGRIDEPGPALTLATQALQRIGAVQGAGVDIAPLMVPPHGVCSLAMFEACLRAGFDAMCIDWPYWWLAESSALSSLSGWGPLDRVRGLPLVPRLHIIDSDLDDLAFRAFLGQPLILYAHHTDLKAGLDLLATRADDVRSLGVTSWESLGSIGVNVVSTRRNGDSLVVTLHSRRAAIEIPDGVSYARFAVSGPSPADTDFRLELRDGAVRQIGLGEPVPVKTGTTVASMSMDWSTPPPPSSKTRWPARATVRRLLSEGRDRAVPVSARLRVRARLRGRSAAWLSLLGCCLSTV